MSPLQGQLPRGVHQRFPAVRLTGRCFLLRPRRSAPTSTLSHNEVECVDLTHGDAMSSRQQPSMPGSLMGNSYYTQRYKSRNSNNTAATTTSSATTAHRFLSGDVILRLQLSAVPHALSGRRIVDVTGTQTSYFNSAERDRHALATVEETLQTMHLHDGHEVPALQRGDVDLVRLQPQCVYAPMLSERLEHRESHSGCAATAVAANSSSLDITNVASALYPLNNPGVLLAQSRRLSFRSEMDAVQVARVMAASVAALRQVSGGLHAAPPSGAVLKPLVRDGHLVSVALRFPRGSGRSG